MNGEPTVARIYPTEMEAELGRVALDAEGIASFVATNDAAGMLRYVQGVQLVVRSDELEAAREILAALDAQAPEPDDQ
jgi:hypothetical protein